MKIKHMKTRFFLFIGIILACLFQVNLFAEDETVESVSFQGNKIVSNATMISKIKIRTEDIYNENIINEDIKSLYATGFFDTVEVVKDYPKDIASGKVVVIFKVKEKPVLKKVLFQGNRFLRTSQIEKVIELKEGIFIDEYKLNEIVRKIKDLYTKKGFSQAIVTYKITKLENEEGVDVLFIIDEQTILKIRGIKIIGNNTFSANRIVRLMKSRKAWLLNSGIFKEEAFQDDIDRVKDFYRSNGFTDVKVDSQVKFESKGVYLYITVEEGKRYYIGKITIEGNKEVPLVDLEKVLTLKEGAVFSEQGVYNESLSLREVYVDKGFIFSQVDPISSLNEQTGKIDVSYQIVENDIAYVEGIEIKGNLKTKDEVIRREMRVYPGERYDGKKVKRSKQKLENLGYFEEIRVGAEPGSEPNKVNLVLDVKEAKTGYVSFGGGYSSIDEFVGFVEVRQRNFDYNNWSTFTGGGQDLSLTANIGTLTSRYQLSFTNPWIFDRPISLGIDGYRKGHSKDEGVGYAYEEQVTGGDLRLGREFTEDLSGTAAYRFDRVKISDVASDASQELKDEAGINNLSSTEFNLNYDTRNNVFSPSKGVIFTNNAQVTGGPWGGSKDFWKYSTRFSVYFPLIRSSVIEFKIRGGIASKFSDTQKVPIYERFFAGGADSIRGYKERIIGPLDAITNNPIGGNTLFLGNVEYTYPIADFLKLATFFDTGNVWWKTSDFFSKSLKSSVGLGIRVKTPIGPVSLDYGWPLDKEPGSNKQKGRFHFNVSRGF